MGLGNFIKQGFRFKTIRNSQRDEVLNQHIHSPYNRNTLLYNTICYGCFQGGRLQQFQAMCGYKPYFAGFAGPVTTSSGTLHKARNTLWTANLNYRIHRPEIDAQIQAAGANHRLERPLMKVLFHPVPNFPG